MVSYPKLLFAALVSSAVIAGCTSTEVHSFRSNNLIGRYYDHMMLVVDIPDVNDRVMIEGLFVKEFEARGLKLLVASDVFPSIRKTTQQQALDIMKQQDIQAVLTLVPSRTLDIESASDKSPLFKSRSLSWANSLSYYDNPLATIPDREPLYTGDLGKFSLRLYDVQTGQIVWLGFSITERTALANLELLMQNNAKETVNELSAEKLILPAIGGK